jgi:hypothetical protein
MHGILRLSQSFTAMNAHSRVHPMPEDVTRTVEVSIPVEARLASALSGARARAAVGRLVSRALGPQASPGEIAEAVAEAKAEVDTHGLTDAGPEAERAAAGKALAAEFREFRRGRTLGGLHPKELIREGSR